MFVPSKRVRKTIKHSDKHHKGTLTDDNQAAASLSTERVGLALGDAARCSQLPHLLERNVLVPTFGEEFVTRMRAHLLKLYSSNDNSYDKSFEPAQKKQKKF